ncbi:MAG: hypothetical protein QOF64_3222, partial [Candidatus Binatota bacterium]|nr:hypothetical protein [Candidatus Binatota bacterium]
VTASIADKILSEKAKNTLRYINCLPAEIDRGVDD